MYHAKAYFVRRKSRKRCQSISADQHWIVQNVSVWCKSYCFMKRTISISKGEMSFRGRVQLAIY